MELEIKTQMVRFETRAGTVDGKPTISLRLWGQAAPDVASTPSEWFRMSPEAAQALEQNLHVAIAQAAMIRPGPARRQ